MLSLFGLFGGGKKSKRKSEKSKTKKKSADKLCGKMSSRLKRVKTRKCCNSSNGRWRTGPPDRRKFCVRDYKPKRKSAKKSRKSRKSKSRKSKKKKSKRKSAKKSKPKRKSVKKSKRKSSKKSKRKSRKSKSNKKSLGKGGSIQDAIRVYERACKRAEKNKRANPGETNNDCGSIKFHADQGRMSKSKIETYTRMHLLALKIGNDAYHMNNAKINSAYKAQFGTLKV